MRRAARFLAAALALLGAGCAPRTQPRAAAPSVVLPRQQVWNAEAVDADPRLEEWRRTLATQPDHRAARLALAQHYEQEGSPELALEHYRLAAERWPRDEDVHLRLAALYRNLRLLEDATGVLQRFCERVPDGGASAHSLLGVLLDERGLLAAAEAEHREALRRAPQNDAYHNNLGYNLLLQNRYGAAIPEFRRALALRPRSVIARNNLGVALARSTGAGGEQTFRRPDEEVLPHTPDALRARRQEALVHWQSVSDPATAHSNLAAILMETGDSAGARQELELALGYQRTHAAALSNLHLLAEREQHEAVLPPAAIQYSRFRRLLAWLVGEPLPSKPSTPGAARAANPADLSKE